MALETMKGVKEIDGFKAERMVNFEFELEGEFTQEQLNKVGVAIHDKGNTIVFKIQNGPIKENGVNGCQVDTLVATAIMIIRGLNEKFPSHYNEMALDNLQAAYNALGFRKLDRERRGVEGENKA